MTYEYQNGIEPQRYGLSLQTAPVSEPVTLAEVKTHCRVDISTDDTYLSEMITAAREYIEKLLGRRIFTQTWDLVLDSFPQGFRDIPCPYGPWQSISYIHYIDLAGTTQTWAASNYNLDVSSFKPRIYLSYGQIYPVSRPIQNAVTIRHINGATAVPKSTKQLIYLLVEHWYNTARGIETQYKTEKHVQAFESLLAVDRQSWL